MHDWSTYLSVFKHHFFINLNRRGLCEVGIDEVVSLHVKLR